MPIHRIIPYTNPKLCMAINPFKDNIKLGIFPIFQSCRSLWNIEEDTTQITNYCHPNYGLKVYERNGLDLDIGLTDPYNIMSHFYMTRITDNVCTFQVSSDKKFFVSFDKYNGLTLDYDSNIDMDNNLWIISKALDPPQQLLHRLKQASTTC